MNLIEVLIRYWPSDFRFSHLILDGMVMGTGSVVDYGVLYDLVAV